ncbi:sugar phosphate nucleotidyltransferase [Tomitella fengzijianii]|uniref:Glucose-1-phosphate cytidylyltransferase n=1 Tax=Tomitella fengzijianii TaxID=2597660 RepID=A0A516X213_9ACTN|nr:sugar phosphate nucleotidyltransferase [Tomitella fengzijianii]QDQ96661.1 glucose-1-phosphate cytidylyltransferase [Tomitella fengzijianii]
MKVVLFCGGYGMRMRNSAHDQVPKPLQMVGPRPLIWHVMRYYAHFGHTEFILCLGYGARSIKEYFLSCSQTAAGDFTLHGGQVQTLSSDLDGWSITFVDTGLESAIGERLRRVRPYLDGDGMFLANYADVLTDAPLDRMVDRFDASGAAASMLIVPPQSSFHCVDTDNAGLVTAITPVSRFPVYENGGYFVLTPEVFDNLPAGGDLVGDACMALAAQRRLFGYHYDGFWKPADTFKERAELDAAYHRGDRPWMVWERAAESAAAPAPEPALA